MPSAARCQTWTEVASSIGVGGERDGVGADRRDGAHLEVGRRDRLAAHQQPTGTVAVGARDDGAVGQQPRHAGDELDPDVVVVLERDLGGAGAGVDAQHVHRSLVARLHGGDEAGLRPPHVGEVRELVAIPLDVDDRAVEADDVQRDLGVGRAGGRIRQLAGLDGGVGRVAEVPALHRRGVDAGDGQGGAVGAPPVAAEAVHLLGGDEVGAAPRDRFPLVVLAAGQDPPRAVELADAQQAPADVGDALGQRIGTRVEDRPGHRQLARLARHQPADEQPPGDGEGGDPAVAIGGEGGDAAGALAGPLPAGLLLGRQLLVVAAAEQDLGVADEVLVAGRRVDDPQAVDRRRCRPGCAGTRCARRPVRPRRRAARRGCSAGCGPTHGDRSRRRRRSGRRS